MTIADWSGLVQDRNDAFSDLIMVAPVANAGGSWSGPFRVIANDNRGYFVKSLDLCPSHGRASLAIEFIASQVGQLIGAPVCHTSLIRIPDALGGWEPRPGVPLQPGLAHASLALDHADERGRPVLVARNNDDNQRRHVGVYAMFDWLWGSDQQWLYDLDDDQSIYSHDHGLYLPPNTGTWTLDALIATADQPNELPDSPDGLNPEAVESVALRLQRIDRQVLAKVLSGVPASWPVSNDDLEGLGWYLEYRAPAVASRIRALV